MFICLVIIWIFELMHNFMPPDTDSSCTVQSKNSVAINQESSQTRLFQYKLQPRTNKQCWFTYVPKLVHLVFMNVKGFCGPVSKICRFTDMLTNSLSLTDVINPFLSMCCSYRWSQQPDSCEVVLLLCVWWLCSWYRLFCLMSSSQLAVSSVSEHCVLCRTGWVLLMLMPCCPHRSRLIPALCRLSTATQELWAAGENPVSSFSFLLTLTQGCGQEYKTNVELQPVILLITDELSLLD